MINTPNPNPSSAPPEQVTDRLTTLRTTINTARDQSIAIAETVWDEASNALRESRIAAFNMTTEARDRLRSEIAAWNIDQLPDALKASVEETRITVDSIYRRFQENTVPFTQNGLEKGVSAVTKMVNMLSDTAERMQSFLAKTIGPLLFSLTSFGITVPEWLLPQGPGMKELFAALSANKRTFEAGSKDDENMREVISVLSNLNANKPAAQQRTLESFLTSIVEQGPPDKKALSTADILEGAKRIAEEMQQAPAAAPAPAAAATSPAPAPEATPPAPVSAPAAATESTTTPAPATDTPPASS
jgi:hypothetical protein